MPPNTMSEFPNVYNVTTKTYVHFNVTVTVIDSNLVINFEKEIIIGWKWQSARLRDSDVDSISDSTI